MNKKIIILFNLSLGLSSLNFAQTTVNSTEKRQNMLLNAADEDPVNLMRLGTTLYKQHRFPDALTIFGKAATKFNERKAYKDYGNAVLKMSDAHYAMKNYAAAEQSVINVALKAFGKASDKNGMMRCYQSLGNIYLGLNKPVESLWFFAQQGNLAEQIGDQVSLTESLLSVATVKIIRKQYSLANKDLNALDQRIVRLHQEEKYAVLIGRMKKLVQSKMPAKK